MRVALISFLLLSACAGPAKPGLELIAMLGPCEKTQTSHDPIVGGQQVSLSDPDQNLVTMLRTRRAAHDSVCTGALISDRVILTAAHCVAGAEVQDVEAQFITGEGCPAGRHKRILAVVNQIIIHRQFDGTPKSLADLALVRLEDKAPNDQHRLPLIKAGVQPTADRILFMGFGITSETEKDSQILRRVFKSYRADLQRRDRAILVSQKDRGGFCRGDSGAPILVDVFGEPHILGVNSANIAMTSNTPCHEMSVAMDVTAFGSWIESNRERLDSSTWLKRLVVPSVEQL